jgi:hypothetical protein
MGKRKDSPKLASTLDGLLNIERCLEKADEEDWNAGLSYYDFFRGRVIRAGTGIDARVACGVYAALSPNNSEESCMDDTRRLCEAYLNGSFDSCRVHTYGKNKEKAGRILLGEDPATVLRGIKTNNFFHNLIDPLDRSHVTIDGHMVNIWNNRRVPLDLAGINDSEYRMIAESLMLFCRILEMNSGQVIFPCQLQSVLWLTWRRINGILYKPQYRLVFE